MACYMRLFVGNVDNYISRSIDEILKGPMDLMRWALFPTSIS